MPTTNSYDALPYSCRAIKLTHPDNLACKARLYGLQPANTDRCRVLEIGCGNGMNLLSLSQILPGAVFVGVDSSESQIAEGQIIAKSIGCGNVQLRAQPASDLTTDDGAFDYILCHGVYSWVSPDAAEHILVIIRQLLAPEGVAYVSYNTYPGWHQRGMVREMFAAQINPNDRPAEQVRQARQYLDFLISHVSETSGTFQASLQREYEILSKSPDAYLFHEHLSQWNVPVYFRQFAQRCANNGLQYLCEAAFNRYEAQFSPELHSHLQQSSRSRIDFEQQVDWLCHESFRRSLLCQAHAKVEPQPSIAAMVSMFFRAAGKWEPPAKHQDDRPATFHGPSGETITTSHPLLKASLSALARAWPAALSLDEIFDTIEFDNLEQTAWSADAGRRDMLCHALLRCHRAGLVEFFLRKPTIVRTIDRRPYVSALARWQAANNQPVSNFLHEMVELNFFDRMLIAMLDGQTETSELVSRLRERVARGEWVGLTADVSSATAMEHAVALSLKKLAQLSCLGPAT